MSTTNRIIRTSPAHIIAPTAYHAFTLIELSIVLLIIGLVAGGILVGRDMIHQAEIRKTISQVQSFETATNTFRNKYNCLPGDCATADQVGLNGECPSSTPGCTNGNGDDKIGTCYSDFTYCGTLYTTVAHEYIDYWYHLSAAGFINEPLHSYYWWTNVNTDPTAMAGSSGISTPAASITTARTHSIGPVRFPSGWLIKHNALYDVGNPSFWTNIDTISGHSFIQGTNATPAPNATMNGDYFVADIYAIDAKTDDGMPASGSVRGYGIATASGSVAMTHHGSGAADGLCVTADTPPRYNVLGTDVTYVYCGAIIKTSF